MLEHGEFDDIAITPARERNPWVVLTSTSLAVFAVFLDTTIGFVSFPAISETFESAGPSTVSWVLNAYTLVFAALLDPRRPAGRPGRAPAAVPHRGRRVHDGLDAVRPGSHRRLPDRRARCWRRSAPPSSCRRRWRWCCRRSRGPRSRWRSPSGEPSVPSPVPPARRSGRCVVEQPQLAVGVLHQPARRPRELPPRPRRAARGPRGRTRSPARSRSASWCWPPASPRSPTPSWRPTRGGGRAPASPSRCSPVSPCSPSSSSAAVASPTRCSTSTCSRADNFRWANAAIVVFADRVQRHVPRQRPVPHAGCGATRSCAPASPSRSGRSSSPSRPRSSAGWPGGSASAACSCPAGSSGPPAGCCCSLGPRPRRTT